MVLWETKSLGDIYDVRDGTHDSPKYQPEGYPLVTSKNLKNGGITLEKVKYISEYDYLKINQRSAVHQGDVLFAMIGTIGNPIVVEVEPDFAIKNVALFKVPEEQNSCFLKYYLESTYVVEKMQREAKGTTQKFVGLGYLRNFPIEIPPLAEQQRIVTILDETFAGIAAATVNAEQNLKNARELFDSYLSKLFNDQHDGWAVYKLGDLCSFLNGFAFKSKDTVETSNCQLIRMGNLYQNKLDLERKPSFYPDAFANEYERFRLYEGDLIISLTGTVDKEDYGYTVEIPPTERLLLLNQRIAKFIDINESLVNKDFLLFVLRSRHFLDGLYATARGVRQANLSTVSMKSLEVSLPPTDEQSSIVEKLEYLQSETQRLEAIYQQKLDALAELKQSLLQKAFAGELH